MLIIFSFAYNSETQEAAMSGNIDAQAALGILQQLVVAQAIKKAKEPDSEPAKKEETK